MSIFTCWISFAGPLEGTGYQQIYSLLLSIKVDDATVALLRKSFKWVFDKGFPVLSHSLLLMKGWPQSGNLREKRRKVKELKQLVQS